MREILYRRVVSETLIRWLRSVYEEEIDWQERLDLKRKLKLWRAVVIVEGINERLLLRAFKEWKRMKFQVVLEGLKKYSETLERVSMR